MYHSIVTKPCCIINSNEYAIFKAIEWLRMRSVRKQKSAVFLPFVKKTVFSHVMECTLLCSAISGVRYSQLALLSYLTERVTFRVPVYRHFLQFKVHSTASLVILLSIFFYFAVNFTRN